MLIIQCCGFWHVHLSWQGLPGKAYMWVEDTGCRSPTLIWAFQDCQIWHIKWAITCIVSFSYEAVAPHMDGWVLCCSVLPLSITGSSRCFFSHHIVSQIGILGAHKEFLSDESAISYEREVGLILSTIKRMSSLRGNGAWFLIRCPRNWTILVSFAFHPTLKDKQRPWREFGQLNNAPFPI